MSTTLPPRRRWGELDRRAGHWHMRRTGYGTAAHCPSQPPAASASSTFPPLPSPPPFPPLTMLASCPLLSAFPPPFWNPRLTEGGLSGWQRVGGRVAVVPTLSGPQADSAPSSEEEEGNRRLTRRRPLPHTLSSSLPSSQPTHASPPFSRPSSGAHVEVGWMGHKLTASERLAFLQGHGAAPPTVFESVCCDSAPKAPGQ